MSVLFNKQMHNELSLSLSLLSCNFLQCGLFNQTKWFETRLSVADTKPYARRRRRVPRECESRRVPRPPSFPVRR